MPFAACDGILGTRRDGMGGGTFRGDGTWRSEAAMLAFVLGGEGGLSPGTRLTGIGGGDFRSSALPPFPRGDCPNGIGGGMRFARMEGCPLLAFAAITEGGFGFRRGGGGALFFFSGNAQAVLKLGGFGGGGGGPPFVTVLPSIEEPRLREYEYLGFDMRFDENRLVENELPLRLREGGGGALLADAPDTPFTIRFCGVGGAAGGTNAELKLLLLNVLAFVSLRPRKEENTTENLVIITWVILFIALVPVIIDSIVSSFGHMRLGPHVYASFAGVTDVTLDKK